MRGWESAAAALIVFSAAATRAEGPLAQGEIVIATAHLSATGPSASPIAPRKIVRVLPSSGGGVLLTETVSEVAGTSVAVATRATLFALARRPETLTLEVWRLNLSTGTETLVAAFPYVEWFDASGPVPLAIAAEPAGDVLVAMGGANQAVVRIDPGAGPMQTPQTVVNDSRLHLTRWAGIDVRVDTAGDIFVTASDLQVHRVVGGTLVPAWSSGTSLAYGRLGIDRATDELVVFDFLSAPSNLGFADTQQPTYTPTPVSAFDLGVLPTEPFAVQRNGDVLSVAITHGPSGSLQSVQRADSATGTQTELHALGDGFVVNDIEINRNGGACSNSISPFGLVDTPLVWLTTLIGLSALRRTL